GGQGREGEAAADRGKGRVEVSSGRRGAAWLRPYTCGPLSPRTSRSFSSTCEFGTAVAPACRAARSASVRTCEPWATTGTPRATKLRHRLPRWGLREPLQRDKQRRSPRRPGNAYSIAPPMPPDFDHAQPWTPRGPLDEHVVIDFPDLRVNPLARPVERGIERLPLV